ncbi:apolipoprotein D [Tetranychus urticae]|uniref:Lipocalin/cytosolic fatty-acid binding domain-containing protein n=1 Tax=Tetranychus urticae TaxID=32264 RepID=T1KDZ2_TETUR|nr:apolipoprotein D [Tetranychus urticae]
MKQFVILCVFAFSFVPAFEAAGLFQLDSIKTSFLPGRCPEPARLPQPLDFARYLGEWYEIKSTKPIFENGLRCIKANYFVDTYPVIFVNNSGVDLANNTIFSLGAAAPTQQDNVLEVKFFKYSPYAQYWVVDTDYDNYALVVSCNNIFPFFNPRDAWILSRKPTLDDDTVKNLVAKLDSVGIKDTEFLDTVQNC